MKIIVKKTKKSFDLQFEMSPKELSLMTIIIKAILFFSYHQKFRGVLFHRL